MKKLIILFIFFFTLYAISSKGHTPYNYFTRLADAFLHGRLYLTEAPSWLSELIPVGENRWYVVYPPLPAILIIPFVAILKTSFYQEYFSFLVGALISVVTYKTYKKHGEKTALFTTLLVGMGSIVWFMSSDGSVWFLGQLVGCLFLSLMMLEYHKKRRPLVLGILLGLSYLARINTALAAPFFLWALFSKKDFFQKYIKFFLGFLPFLILNALYNYARFGVFYDVGYFLLPALLHETTSPWFIHGVMNPLYIPENIRTAFWTFPKRIQEFPYVIPSWYGLSIWVTTPAFLYAIKGALKGNLTKVAFATVILMFLFVAMHGGTGWAQFGYRFAVDFYPLLVYLVVSSFNKNPTKVHWLLLFLGILVNLWGVVCINKFGWVSF